MSRARLWVAVALLLSLLAPNLAWAQPKRPSKHTEYAEALRKIDFERWQEAVPLLRQAIAKWKEDGELTSPYGSRLEPYLPELYLGEALFHLGCFAEAKQHLDASVLHTKSVRRAEEEELLLAELTDRNAEQLRLGTPPPEGAPCAEPK